MELTHSTHSLKDNFDDPGLWPPTPPELRKLIQKNATSFSRSKSLATKSKATQYVDTMDEVQRVQYSRKRTPYWFVTINPKPSVTIQSLHNRVVDLLSREDIQSPTWCYEIRKKPDQGLHAHILFTCHSQDKNFADRKVKSLFVPDLCQTRKHVHIKWIHESELAATRSYIIKKYSSKSKAPSTDATVAWRKKHKIPSQLGEDHLLVWSELSLSAPEESSNIPSL